MGKYAEVTPVHMNLLVCLNSLQELKANKFPNPGFPQHPGRTAASLLMFPPCTKKGLAVFPFLNLWGIVRVREVNSLLSV